MEAILAVGAGIKDGTNKIEKDINMDELKNL
jgi:hypothetical protein